MSRILRRQLFSIAELLEKANIEPSTRAQQCTLEDFIRLYEVTYAGTGKGKN